MFAISVELLSGRYVATAYNDRDRVEWPPHPARLFSALVATWADGEPEPQKAELAALHWLERQPAPEVFASDLAAAGIRDVMPVFVPVNDVGVVSQPGRDKLDEAEAALVAASEPKARARAGKLVEKLEQKLLADTARAIGSPTKFANADLSTAEKLVSDRRTRQPRTFPSATPECPTVGFVWSDAEPPDPIRAALASLLSRLVRLGHSSSLVRAAALAPEDLPRLAERTARYRPDEAEGDWPIRWVGAGQTEQLVRAFEIHRETEPRVLPARFVRYAMGERRHVPAVPRGVFADEFVVLSRVGGPRLPVTAIAGVARQMRRALMSHAEEPIHEVLSGHKADGTASEAPHLAIAPLPVVTGPHADGAILGIALVLPREIDDAARRAVMRAVDQMEEHGSTDGSTDPPAVLLHLAEAGELKLQRVAWGEDRRATLRSSTWCHASRWWASATPVALDRNPGDLHHPDPDKRRAAFREATACVVEAVERTGLPTPAEVDVVRSCVLSGTAKPRAYPRFPAEARRTQRVLVHARLVFAEPVRGPILVGAGRYQGMGLFLPVDDRSAEPA